MVSVAVVAAVLVAEVWQQWAAKLAPLPVQHSTFSWGWWQEQPDIPGIEDLSGFAISVLIFKEFLTLLVLSLRVF